MRQIKYFFYFIVLAFICLSLAPASSATPLDQLFAASFADGSYQENRCGQNVLNLVKLAEAQGLSLEGANVLEIYNRGGTELDPVWGLNVRSHGTRRWMFHSVLEMNGVVFDFDFGNSPRPTLVREYFKAMFLDVAARGPYVGYSPEPLTDYMVRAAPARDYVRYIKGGPSPRASEYASVSLQNYLASFY